MNTDEQLANDVLAVTLKGYAESAEIGLISYMTNDMRQFGFEYGAWSAFAIILDALGVEPPEEYNLNDICIEVADLIYKENKQ